MHENALYTENKVVTLQRTCFRWGWLSIIPGWSHWFSKYYKDLVAGADHYDVMLHLLLHVIAVMYATASCKILCQWVPMCLIASQCKAAVFSSPQSYFPLHYTVVSEPSKRYNILSGSNAA